MNDLVSTNIEAILIIERGSGLPLLLQKLDPRVIEIDPALVSGFLFAIQAFSAEVMEKGSTEFQINYGKKLFTVIVGESAMVVAINSGGWSDEVTPIVTDLLDEFERDWYLGIEMHGGDQIYDDFKPRIIERLGLQNVSLDWIPYFKTNDVSTEQAVHVQDHINGELAIGEILKRCESNDDEVLMEISRLWANGDIGFKNTLERCDIVIPTQKLFRYIQSHTQEREELKQFSSKLVQILPRVIQHFDGKSTIDQILQGQPNHLYELLDFLLSKRALEILSAEKKRILLAKELLERCLDVAEDVYSKQEARLSLERALDHIEEPEIITQVHLVEDNEWKIDYGFLVYDGLTPKRVMEIHAIWLKLLKQYVKELPNKKKSKYIEELVSTLQIEFFDRYASDELEGVVEFSFSLEAHLEQ
ncbi:MAG: hypothetical protein GF411_11730 [Candidatus Lokiarchaeota archaeon]|nr:hypothetical protein [Candidatus Lokiarchaeota archaeon]